MIFNPNLVVVLEIQANWGGKNDRLANNHEQLSMRLTLKPGKWELIGGNFVLFPSSLLFSLLSKYCFHFRIFSTIASFGHLDVITIE